MLILVGQLFGALRARDAFQKSEEIMSQFQSDPGKPNRSASDEFGEALVKGAGYAAGGALIGAIVSFVLMPVPGSAELGASLGSKFGSLFGCGAEGGGGDVIG